LRKKKHAQKTSKVKILKNSLRFFSDLSSSPKKKKKTQEYLLKNIFYLISFREVSPSQPTSQLFLNMQAASTKDEALHVTCTQHTQLALPKRLMCSERTQPPSQYKIRLNNEQTK